MSGMDTVNFVGGPVPGFEIGFSISGNKSSGGAAQRVITLFSEMNSLGDATANELSPVYANPNDLEDYAGGASASVAMSPAAYLAHLIFDANPLALVRVMPLALIGSGVKASNTIVFSGTCTTAGTIKIWIDTVLVSFDVAVGDDATDTGDKLVAKFNTLLGKYRPPVKLTNAVGTVTVEACGEGEAMNGLVLEEESNSTAGITTTVTGNLASGSGTYSHTSGLSAMATVRTPLIVSQFNDTDGSTGELDALLDHVQAKSTPQNMLWSKFIAAKSDTRANLATWVDTLDTNDTERACLFGYKGSLNWHASMAANYAAAIAATNNLVLPRDSVPLKHLRAPLSANRWDGGDLALALQSGFCPGRVIDDQVCITRYIHARYDKGVADGNVVDVLDWIAVRLANRFATIGPVNYVPAPDKAKGDEQIDDDGIQDEVEQELIAVEEDDKYLYGVKRNLKDISTTYQGGGAVKVFIPATCLQVVPGLHNVMVEGEHQLDAA